MSIQSENDPGAVGPRTPADPRPQTILPATQRCEVMAAACERTARHLRDPIARDIYARAARRWRSTADESDERLAEVIRFLSPLKSAGE